LAVFYCIIFVHISQRDLTRKEEELWFNLWQKEHIFLFCKASSHTVKPFQPPWGFSLDGKAVGVKSESSEIKNEWSYTSSIPYAFMASTGVTTSLICHF